jgi:hypothetical protein
MISLPGISSLVGHVRAWPMDSQQTSRRNAMIACTALAQRRAEREDVDDFLASRGERREPLYKAAP